jgi:hypothetical protein
VDLQLDRDAVDEEVEAGYTVRSAVLTDDRQAGTRVPQRLLDTVLQGPLISELVRLTQLDVVNDVENGERAHVRGSRFTRHDVSGASTPHA